MYSMEESGRRGGGPIETNDWAVIQMGGITAVSSLPLPIPNNSTYLVYIKYFYILGFVKSI